jgi:hypothetical protein
MTPEEIAEKFCKPDYMSAGTWFNYKLGDEYKRTLKAITYASQFKQPANNEAAIEVVKGRIAAFTVTYGRLSGCETKSKIKYAMDELNHILKLLQL